MHSQRVCRRALAGLVMAFLTTVAVVPGAWAQSVRAGASAGQAKLSGYWVVNRAGGVGAGGGAPELGGLARHMRLSEPVVGMAATPDGKGYWLATAGGNVFNFGDARLFGRAAPAEVQRVGHMVGMAATIDGKGYWLVSSQGRVLNFGDARPFGSLRLAQLVAADMSVTGITATPQGGGYWVVGSNGRIFCFGDAHCYSRHTAAAPKVVGLAPTPAGKGYWLATSTGQVLAFGDAPLRRSAGRAGVNAPGGRGRARMDLARAPGAPVVGIAASRTGAGYWLANGNGSTLGFGRPAAAATAQDLAEQAVAIVPDPAAVRPGRAVPAAPGAQLSASSQTLSPGQLAVRFALAQVGKPYLYGGSGPYAYDCSGLALASWRTVGVTLPRTAAEQYYAGPHVPLSQLQPGDLVFWASDPADPATIYHVAISLGGDETVQATHSGSTVRVMPLWSEDLVPVATVP